MKFLANPMGRPFNASLDQHHAVAVYKFKGYTEESPLVDPGAGYMAFDVDTDDFGLPSFVCSKTDLNGNANMMVIGMLAAMASAEYDFWFFIHSKSRPGIWVGALLDEWNSILDGEDLLGYSITCLPWLGQMRWDDDEGDYVGDTWEEGEELLISLQFGFNPDYVGSLGTQSASEVSISGGTISNTNIDDTNASYLRIPVKEDTGDPEVAYNGQIYLNTFDDKVKIYADGAWRTLLDYAE